MGKIQIRIDLESATLKEFNIPEGLLKAFIQKHVEFVEVEDNDLGSYQNVSKRTRQYVLECMAKANRPLTKRELSNMTGYTMGYTQRILYALMQDKKVTKQRTKPKKYRYILAQPTAKTSKDSPFDPAATIIGTARSRNPIMIDANGMKVMYVEASQRAKSEILKLLRKSGKPITMENIIRRSTYCQSYCCKVIKNLLAEGVVGMLWKKNTPYYQLTAKARAAAEK